MIDAIRLQTNSSVPLYKQLIRGFTEKIESNTLLREQKLPSINVLSTRLDVSRDTVEKAYRELRDCNLIEAVPGKGYFVKGGCGNEKLKILLLFNKFSAHTKIIYDQFVSTLGSTTHIDLHVYNNDFVIFEKLLSSNLYDYSHYVIIPHFANRYYCAYDVINQIDKSKLVVLDKRIEAVTGNYTCIYQDFEQNIYGALSEAQALLAKYDTLKLLFPSWSHQPREIIKGFQEFCIDNNVKGKLVADIESEPIAKREAYITIKEADLVGLVKKIKESQLIVGQEIGILSYNENPLKEVLLDGISVISTDFKGIGETAARMILDNRTGFVKTPFRLIKRNSL